MLQNILQECITYEIGKHQCYGLVITMKHFLWKHYSWNQSFQPLLKCVSSQIMQNSKPLTWKSLAPSWVYLFSNNAKLITPMLWPSHYYKTFSMKAQLKPKFLASSWEWIFTNNALIISWTSVHYETLFNRALNSKHKLGKAQLIPSLCSFVVSRSSQIMQNT